MDLASILAGAKQMGGDSMAGFQAGRNTGQAQPSMESSPLLAALMSQPGAMQALGMMPGGQNMGMLQAMNTPEIRHELDPSGSYMAGRMAGAGTRQAQEALAPENLGRMAGSAFGSMEGMGQDAGQMIGGAMDDGVEAVMSKIMGVGDAMKGGFQEGRSAANPSAGALGTPQTREEVEAHIQRLMQQRAQMGGAPAPQQAAGAAAPQGGGANEAALLLDQAVQAGQGALSGAKDAIGGAIGGMAGNVADSIAPHLAPYTGGAEQQAIGGMSPTTIQHLQQILSPQELQEVMQDPQKMAEIEALMQQQGLMGGQ